MLRHRCKKDAASKVTRPAAGHTSGLRSLLSCQGGSAWGKATRDEGCDTENSGSGWEHTLVAVLEEPLQACGKEAPKRSPSLAWS